MNDAKIAQEGQSGPTVAEIDIAGIMRMIPHRYPMLMLDRVRDVVPNVSAVGIKMVSINEPFFQGHFPRMPVMPGVLIVEAMAQTAAVLVVSTLGTAAEGKLVYFMSVENAKFRKPVVPGEQLEIHVRKDRHRANVWKFAAEAKVAGVLKAEATYAAMILDD
jgi:3-hydroxyacyl-[acyl-carrier-protein] dehydratase